MKIAFLTSGLELGRDGVGDYTRFLGQECVRQGHEISAMALNDAMVKGEPQAGGDSLPMLRFGRSTPWEVRLRQAQQFLADFAPDAISLQFVCYGYHPKGLAFRIGPFLRRLIGRTPLQIMFHETWIAPHLGAAIKERIVGAIQKRSVLGMVRRLAPKVVHTSIAAYVALLARNGVRAGLLPLFGNIPFCESGNPAWWSDELRHHGLDIGAGNRGEHWLFGMFGSLHPNWPPEPLLGFLREASAMQRRKIALLSIGRLGAGETLWSGFEREYSRDFVFHRFGERPAGEVSLFLQGIDFGIATSPWANIGKSGTVAAMIEHGLPVIVNRDDIHFPFAIPEYPRSPLLVKMESDLAVRLPGLRRGPHHSALPEIAAQFLADIRKCVS